MSGYKNHLVAGFLLSGIALAAWYHFQSPFPPEIALIGLSAGAAYSILPDIDIGTSKANHLFTGGGLLAIIYCFYNPEFSKIGIVISAVLLLSLFLKHRGLTHRWWFGALLSLPLAIHAIPIAIASFTGFLSHLALDQR